MHVRTVIGPRKCENDCRARNRLGWCRRVAPRAVPCCRSRRIATRAAARAPTLPPPPSPPRHIRRYHLDHRWSRKVQ
eukprot:622574-Rhodomonas_salina.3